MCADYVNCGIPVASPFIYDCREATLISSVFSLVIPTPFPPLNHLSLVLTCSPEGNGRIEWNRTHEMAEHAGRGWRPPHPPTQLGHHNGYSL